MEKRTLLNTKSGLGRSDGRKGAGGTAGVGLPLHRGRGSEQDTFCSPGTCAAKDRKANLRGFPPSSSQTDGICRSQNTCRVAGTSLCSVTFSEGIPLVEFVSP